MSTLSFPESTDLLPILGTLLGRDLTVTRTDLADPTPHLDRIRTFVADDDRPLAYAGGDLPFAIYASAAMAMIPRERAERAISSGVPDDDLAEVYTEILSVLTRVLNDANDIHVRLATHAEPDPVHVPQATTGATFRVDIDGYGAGLLSLWRP